MYLITMAHLGEALGVIDKFKLEKIKPDLYKNEAMVLLLTGEGPFEAATKTALALGSFEIKEVLNLGIAGTLSSELNVGDTVQVRSIYLINELRPHYKSFPSQDVGFDCLTSFERILDPEKVKILRGLGHLVDREAWGVAYASKTAGIPFRSYKMISDIAGTQAACELVKEDVFNFSLLLSEKLSTLIHQEINLKKENYPTGFHFTFTTSHRFKVLLTKLEVKMEKSEEEILLDVSLDELRALEITPKEKTKLLIERLEHLLDPTKKNLTHVHKELTEQFSQEAIKIQIDPNWEDPKAILSFEVKDDLDIQDKIHSLKKLSIKKFTRIMNGEIDVE